MCIETTLHVYRNDFDLYRNDLYRNDLYRNARKPKQLFRFFLKSMHHHDNKLKLALGYEARCESNNEYGINTPVYQLREAF